MTKDDEREFWVQVFEQTSKWQACCGAGVDNICPICKDRIALSVFAAERLLELRGMGL